MILLFTLEKITRLFALPHYGAILKDAKTSRLAASFYFPSKEKSMQKTPSINDTELIE